MQLDETQDLFTEEPIVKKDSIRPYPPIMGMVDKLLIYGYNNAGPAVAPLAAEDSMQTDTISNLNFPKDGAEEIGTFTLVKHSKNKKKTTSKLNKKKNSRPAPYTSK